MSMTSLITGRTGAASASATNYIGVQENYLDVTPNATAANVEQVVSDAGTLQNFSIIAANAPGAAASGKSYTYTQTKNGVATALTCTMLETATTAADTTHTSTYAAGDTLGIQMVPANTPTTTSSRWGFDNVAAGQNLITQVTNSTNTTVYTPLMSGASQSTTANLRQTVIPTAGAFTLAQIKLSAAPGLTQTAILTLVVNGVDSAMTATVSGTATTGSYSGSVSTAAGDIVNWKDVLSLAATSHTAFIGTTFMPTTNGESIYGFASAANIGVSGNNHLPMGAGAGSASTVENNRAAYNSTTGYTVRNLYASNNTAPGGATFWTITVRSNNANTAVTTTMTGADTTANDTTHSATITGSAYVGINYVGSSTPTTSVVYASFVLYLTPATNYNQNLSDTATSSDANAKTVTTPRADSVTTTDAVAKAFSKITADTATASDSRTATTGKALSDSATVSDAVAKTITKLIADIVTAADSAARTAAYVRAFADIASVTDSISTSAPLLLALADGVTATDNFSYELLEVVVQALSLSLKADDPNNTVTGETSDGLILQSDEESVTIENEVL